MQICRSQGGGEVNKNKIKQEEMGAVEEINQEEPESAAIWEELSMARDSEFGDLEFEVEAKVEFGHEEFHIETNFLDMQ